MMVSKVAVVALVVIVACPILLGYGMNLEENTYVDYDLSDDPIDVTPLLKNRDQYSTAHADYYKLNTNFRTAYNDYSVVPIYQKAMSSAGSLHSLVAVTNWPGGAWGINGSEKTFAYFDYDITSGESVNVSVYSGGTLLTTVNNMTYFCNDTVNDVFTYCYSDNLLEIVEDNVISGANVTTVSIQLVNMSTVPMYFGNQDPNTSTSVDFSGGFRLANNQTFPIIVLPDYTKSYLMTINLNSVSEPNYSLMIDDGYALSYLNKRTVGGVVNWTFQSNEGEQTIYFDETRTDNTYQFFIKQTGEYRQDGRIYYTTHSELRYVGGWPTIIGEARSYITYEHDANRSTMEYSPLDGFNHIRVYTTDLYGDNVFTPIIRIDDATFSAFEYSVIQDKLYDPAGVKNNPSTKLTNIAKYGAFLTFAGVRYDVEDGNITLGTHQVPVKNLVFKSVPITGGYVNMINDVTIAITGHPSKIIFGGEWGCSVITDSMEQYTYTHTDWTPGQFAWDGIDQNFLMVGLLSAIGVFIALGIAYRKTKAALGALLVVCGGAILLFITMI